jgi:hypothetical protein
VSQSIILAIQKSLLYLCRRLFILLVLLTSNPHAFLAGMELRNYYAPLHQLVATTSSTMIKMVPGTIPSVPHDLLIICMSYLTLTEIMFIIPLVNHAFHIASIDDSLWRFLHGYFCNEIILEGDLWSIGSPAPSSSSTVTKHVWHVPKYEALKMTLRQQWYRRIKVISRHTFHSSFYSHSWPSLMSLDMHKIHVRPLPCQLLILPPLLSGVDAVVCARSSPYLRPSF